MLRRFVLSILVATLVSAAATYTYDSAGHLIKIDYGTAGSITYSYDKSGNLISRTVVTTASPAISSLSPTSVPAGSLPFTLTINGTGFVSTSTVQWNGTALTTRSSSATQLTAQVPSTLIQNAGSATVTVLNPGGASSNSTTFTITAGTTTGPSITSLSPGFATAGGAAFALTVTGAGFVAGTSVAQWNGAALPTTVMSATTLTATVSAQLIATSGVAVVTVANTGGSGSNSFNFSISSTASMLSALPHFAAQGVWTTGIFAINTGTSSATFAIAFHDDNGNPISLPFTGAPAASNLSGTVPPLGSAYYEASSPSAQLIEGWGQITADPSIVIQALFRENSAGTYYEAAVPSNAGSKEFEIPFDATTFAATGAPFYTGFAIANLDPSTAANITCTAYDSGGLVIPGAFTTSTGPPQLNPLGHWAGYQFPALAGQMGTIDCVSNTNIAATALRFIGNNAFSSLPVIDKPAAPSPATSALPHFAAQDVWTTGLFLINTSASKFASFGIAFHQDNGSPITLPFDSGPTSNLTGSLPPLASAYYEASEPMLPLIDGWGLITADPSVVVQALFRENSTGTYYEAAVPSNAGSKEFEIPFDATTFAATGALFYTGFAIANMDSANTATISCTARDSTGTIIPNAFTTATGPPQLNPLGHWAGYLFPALTGIRGTIDCMSNTTIAAIALRFIGTNAFSSLPVINK